MEPSVAIVHPAYGSFLERWGSSVANIFVVLGVGGEILFSRFGYRRQQELSLRAKNALTEATQRAARAEEQLSPRSVSKTQFEELRKLKGKIASVWLTSLSDIDLRAWDRRRPATTAAQRLWRRSERNRWVIPFPRARKRPAPLIRKSKRAGARPSIGAVPPGGAHASAEKIIRNGPQ